MGTIRRRSRQKKAARDSLQAALDSFEEIGARLWAERVRAELARIGGRALAADALTPTEQRVAELVAAGGTYREVADALSSAEDGAMEPVEDLPEARHPLTLAARCEPRCRQR